MHLSLVVMTVVMADIRGQQQSLKRIQTTTTQRALTTTQRLLEHPAKSLFSVVQDWEVGWLIQEISAVCHSCRAARSKTPAFDGAGVVLQAA